LTSVINYRRKHISQRRRAQRKTAKKAEGFMAIFKGRDEPGDTLINSIKSLGEEDFLKHLSFFVYLFEKEEAKERLRAISQDWKKKIEKKKLESALEHSLYLIHLCPRLMDLPEFGWLKEKFYGILMMRLWSSKHDKSYWKALEKVKKDFTPGRPRTPEKKLMVARQYENHRNLWIEKEISRTCKELLETYNYKGKDEDVKWGQLLRRVKIPRKITKRELERLNRIDNEEIKTQGEYLMLPLLIQDNLARTRNEKERGEAEKFWLKIWKPISKGADREKPIFIEAVAKEMGLSRETTRKLLKQAGKEMIESRL
jgi:hypothetical protein